MIEAAKTGASPAEPSIESTFRNGSLTAISVVLGFSLSFLNRWAALPGPWTRSDVVAVAAISTGIGLQIVSVALLLFLASLALRRYNHAVVLFLLGLAFVVAGVALAITGDILGHGQNILRDG